MKHHLMIALGLLMTVIFAYRGANALLEPGFGLLELYILGGLVLSGYLLFSGYREWRSGRGEQNGEDKP